MVALPAPAAGTCPALADKGAVLAEGTATPQDSGRDMSSISIWTGRMHAFGAIGIRTIGATGDAIFGALRGRF
ncbi:hypothetical protein BDW68DRAFT_171960 [Aspergillus falconensis]